MPFYLFSKAAACVARRPDYELVGVRTGETDLTTEIDCSLDDPEHCAPAAIDNKFVAKIVHLKYRKDFDIALLLLAKKVVFNEFVQPICLPLDQSLWTKDYAEHLFDVAGLNGLIFKTK